MIEKSDDRVWVYSDITKKYYLLGAGVTHLQEEYHTALLETPNINSPLCKREILYHTGQLEFEGFQVNDDAMGILLARRMKRGNDAMVTIIIANRKDVLTGTFAYARRVRGYVCIENPGTGEGPMGSRIKGKIVYAETPEEGIFDESSQAFG